MRRKVDFTAQTRSRAITELRDAISDPSCNELVIVHTEKDTMPVENFRLVGQPESIGNNLISTFQRDKS